ncbi:MULTISPECIES: hypothetical protein [Rhizobium]|uniref:Flagellin n=1 Tax=Rhizobium paranaense TaxID=1650438 RepID=A0A7W8XPP6_9HYPH|nr:MULTISPECIES: hypothetical protein [Rhizobium]MBB5573312.1 hypothetical protein [Rhizobium paranaense]
MTDIATLTLTADSSSIKAANTNLASMTVATWNAQKGTGALAKAFAVVTGNATASRGALDKVAVGAAA